MLARGEGGGEKGRAEGRAPGGFPVSLEERSPTFLRRAFFATRKNREEKEEKKKGTFGDEIPRRNLSNRGS